MYAFFALKCVNNLYCVGNEFRRLNENFVHRSQPSGPVHPYGNPLFVIALFLPFPMHSDDEESHK
jgi:hypothetical protein